MTEQIRATVRAWFNGASIVQYTGPNPEGVLAEMWKDSRLPISLAEFSDALAYFGLRPYLAAPGQYWMQSAEPQIDLEVST